jgi:hypothetical protein
MGRLPHYKRRVDGFGVERTRDADAKERFVHEAQAASALDHPNICTIHEIDETPDRELFLTWRTTKAKR